MSDDPKTPDHPRWRQTSLPATGVWAMRRRLAEAMRQVVERLVISDAPESELATAAERLEQYAEHLATHPVRQRYVGVAETALAERTKGGGYASPTENDGEGPGGGHFDFSPFIGRSNPLSPPIEVWPEGERAAARVTFGSAYEGPPGCVHGGYVAAAFDEVLGFVQSLTGSPGMTGRLITHYRKPTPLHTELRFDAWVEGVSGRKITAKGTLHAGDVLCAEGEGLFISILPGTFQKLIAEREGRES